MKQASYEYIRPYAEICLNMSPEDDSVYLVTNKQDFDIPNLFGKLPIESASFACWEYLILEFDQHVFGEHRLCSLFTTNQNAMGRTESNPFNHDEEITLIARFTLSPSNRACFMYNGDEVILNFSENHKMFYLQAYRGLAGCNENVLKDYGLGLAEIRVA